MFPPRPAPGLAIVLLLAGCSGAQVELEPLPQDLTELSLEELLEIPILYAAASEEPSTQDVHP